MLRVWQNETKWINGKAHIRLTHHHAFVGNEGEMGYQERLRHAAQIMAGARCYMIMCEPRDTNEVPRVIKAFNERELFFAGEIVELECNL